MSDRVERGRTALGRMPVGQLAFLSSILALALGGLGGSFQPSRLLLLFGVAWTAVTTGRFGSVRSVRMLYWAFVGILAIGILSLPLTSDLASGIGLLVTTAVGMTAVLLVPTTDGLGAAKMVRACWILALSGTLVVAAVEIVTGAHFALSIEDRAVGGTFGELPYASVFFGNYNNYSAYLCLAYPLVLGALMDARSWGRRLFLILCAVLTAAVVVVNTSRMAMLFVAFVTVCALLVQRRSSRLIPILLLAAVAGIVQATEFSWQYTLLRLSQVFSDESTNERAGLVMASLDALWQSLGLGLGPGGFVNFAESSYPHLIPNPHNMLLEFAVNFGLLGAALFVAAIVVIWMAAWRARTLPLGLRFPLLVTLPCVPLIGAINSLAVGYTYWWVWIASMVAIVAAGSPGAAERSTGSIDKASIA